MTDRETTGREKNEELDERDLDQVIGGLGNFEIRDPVRRANAEADKLGNFQIQHLMSQYNQSTSS